MVEKTGKGTPSLQELILYSILAIEDKGEACTFERLVKECFELFPKAFSLSRYAQWPDSLKLDRALRTLRTKGFVVGNPNTHFSLTRFGRKVAENVKTKLEGKTLQELGPTPSSRSPELKYFKGLKESEVFKRYLQAGEMYKFDQMELRELMNCTMETPLRIVKQNIQYAIKLTEEQGEHELLSFLRRCKEEVEG